MVSVDIGETMIKEKTLENMSKDERSLLLYLETRAVDYGGIMKHYNKRNTSLLSVREGKNPREVLARRDSTPDTYRII